ncbi:hypothetical protein GYMLUDRAFT_258424 [Collybiopsis luxurians FD-317 M1]|nr:hypothetical protein GYMLUDRAFT_258424 [Collybiopsis luxurians FD-317 M1]
MDINDAAGIQALLEQLKSSQAWQEAVASSSAPNENQVAPQAEEHCLEESQSDSAPSSSVAELLSQLQTEPNTDHSSELSPSRSVPQPISTPSIRTVDESRHLTFQQALPVIASLSANPQFIQTLKSIKEEQNALENRLLDERKAIIAKYEDKLKVAKTKASMIGSGISKHEASMLSETFQKELKSFDAQRALPAWDGLVVQQQETLAQMGVPTMFASVDASTRERQQKVIQVLEGLL